MLTLLLFALPAISIAQTEPIPVASSNSPIFTDLFIKPVTQRPCLLIDAADIPEVKRRFEAMPNHPPVDPRKMDSTLYALLYWDKAARIKVTQDFMTQVRKTFEDPAKPAPEHVSYPLIPIRFLARCPTAFFVLCSTAFL